MQKNQKKERNAKEFSCMIISHKAHDKLQAPLRQNADDSATCDNTFNFALAGKNTEHLFYVPNKYQLFLLLQH